jgi:hypothetical protein
VKMWQSVQVGEGRTGRCEGRAWGQSRRGGSCEGRIGVRCEQAGKQAGARAVWAGRQSTRAEWMKGEV